jgi:hypothetical protein
MQVNLRDIVAKRIAMITLLALLLSGAGPHFFFVGLEPTS